MSCGMSANLLSGGGKKHACIGQSFKQNQNNYFDGKAGKHLPRKIVLSMSEFDALSEDDQIKIKQYNNEVKIYAHYYRDVYDEAKPKFVTLPKGISDNRLDVDPNVGGTISLVSLLNSLKPLNKLFNTEEKIDMKKFGINISFDKYTNSNTLKENTAPFVSDDYFKTLVKYNKDVYDSYAKDKKAPKCLSMPKMPKLSDEVMNQYLANAQSRRKSRTVGAATKEPYRTRAAPTPAKGINLDDEEEFPALKGGAKRKSVRKSGIKKRKSTKGGAKRKSARKTARKSGIKKRKSTKGGAKRKSARKSGIKKRKSTKKSVGIKRKSTKGGAKSARKSARKSIKRRVVKSTRRMRK